MTKPEIAIKRAVGTPALLFALRFIEKTRCRAKLASLHEVLSKRAKLSASRDEPTVALSPRLRQAGLRVGRTDTSLSTAEDGSGHV